MKPKNVSVIATTLLAIFSSSIVWSHTTIVSKNTPDGYAVRAEMEGTSSVLNQIGISHGCAGASHDGYLSVKAMSVVLPNAVDAIATRADTGEVLVLSDNIDGNAIMSTKPVQDTRIFSSMAVKKGNVPEFNSHGLRTTDVTALHYWGGELNPDFLGLVPFRASFPRFKAASCAVKMTVRMAIANYCSSSTSDDNRADIWMGELTDKYNDESVVSSGFWPAITVLRDVENNPLPTDCEKGFELLVTPSADQIDGLLPLNGYWPAKL